MPLFTCQRGDPGALGGDVVHVGLRNQSHLVGGFWCQVAEHEAGESPRELLCPLAAWLSSGAIFQAVVARVLGQQLGPRQAESAGGDVGGVEPVGSDDICKRDSGQKSPIWHQPPEQGTPAGPAPLGGDIWQHH